MMGLLTLPGPQFLKIYFIGCVLIFILTAHCIEWSAPAPRSHERVRDPYAIAYLRGELNELIRVVTLSLALRGLLKVDHKGIQTVNPAEIERAQVPIEKVMLAACRQRVTPVWLEANASLQAVGRDCQRYLVERGLVHTEAGMQTRRRWIGAVMALLTLLAVSKVFVALSTGHPNILFLVIVWILFMIALLAQGRRRLTRQGRRALQDLNTLFAHLKRRHDSLPPSAISEATLLAAVFGLYSLMGIDRNAWTRMFLRVNTASSNGGVSGGCGGGGCGGGGGGGGGCGGGGCGGCGS